MDKLPIGELITGAAERDAIHIAICPVVAAERLLPGAHVGFLGHSNELYVGKYADNTIGIIDPFLKGVVEPGQRCYLFLYPNSITSLRHVWTHPALDSHVYDAGDAAQPKYSGSSMVYLKEFASTNGVTYDELMKVIRSGSAGIHVSLAENLNSCGDDFWEHYETVTGHEIPDEDRHTFRCSC